MKIKIDKDLCIGCGTCAALCDEVFKLNDEFKAELKAGANLDTPCLKEAIEACPVEAIKIEE
ncbi:MAG: ferredoxin [Parcubacteria group bacterium CG10_big_fil_rev_8_21_14_0_10_36_14]|nr:MAG: ferredoxin [Parcubacteria group bacterium CG10_big_fil_rev_8_21_14_0_10_36_14]